MKVYEITEYSLIGKILNVYQERSDLNVVVGANGQLDTYIDENGDKVIQNFRTEFTTRLNDYKGKTDVVDLVDSKDFPKFLPFFADVTEDIPGYLKLSPKTYKNCQLLRQKHGGYLEFYDHETKKTLRIAINSHTYTPVK